MSKSQAMALLTSRNTNEWYTPPDIIARARKALGGTIDLDPCTAPAAQEYIQATRFYTINNPLDPREVPITDVEAWRAGTVWCNPPFDNTAAWASRLSMLVTTGVIWRAVMLVNGAYGYRWFEDAWRLWPICALRERLHFIEAETGAPAKAAAKKSQVLIFMDHEFKYRTMRASIVWPFTDAFTDLGRIIYPD